MYYAYVLYSPKFNQIYIGQTKDITRRLREHNLGFSVSTKRYLPWQLIHLEEFELRSEAMRREKQLKSHKGRDWIRVELLNKL